MNALSAKKVDEALKRLTKIAPEIVESYRWAEKLGFGRRVRDQAKVTTSTTSRPTETIATDEALQRARNEVKRASRLILRGAASLEGALASLDRVHNLVSEDDHQPPVAAFHDSSPRLEDPAEVRKAERAQARRKARGEGWGEG